MRSRRLARGTGRPGPASGAVAALAARGRTAVSEDVIPGRYPGSEIPDPSWRVDVPSLSLERRKRGRDRVAPVDVPGRAPEAGAGRRPARRVQRGAVDGNQVQRALKLDLPAVPATCSDARQAVRNALAEVPVDLQG